MSVYGQWLNATISASGTTTASIDLGRDYDYISVIVPPMASCTLQLMVSETEGGTYYDLGAEVTTDEEAFNRADVWRLGGYRFIKIKSSVLQATAVTIRVRGMRY